MDLSDVCGVVDVLPNATEERFAPPTETQYWFGSPRASNSGTGAFVSELTALAHSAVWGGVKRIAEDVSRLPLYLYADSEDRTSKVSQRDPTQFACLHRWNQQTSAVEGWQRLMVHAVLWNHGYALIRRTAGRGLELYNLNPWEVTVQERYTENRFENAVKRPRVYQVSVDGYGGTEFLEPSEIIHVRGMTIQPTDDWQTFNLIWHARQAVALALAVQDHGAAYFGRGTVSSGTLEFPLQMPPELTDKIIEQFTKMQSGTYSGSGGNRFKAIPLFDGVKWTPLEADGDKSQMVQTREEVVRDVARWLGLPPSKLGVTDSVSYNSLEQSNRDYIDSSLSGWLSTITAECELKLLSRNEVGSRRFAHDVGELIRADVKTEAESAKVRLESGVTTYNEERTKGGMPPLADPWADARMVPSNMILVDPDGMVLSGANVAPIDSTEEPEPPAPPVPPPMEDEPPEEDERSRLTIADIAPLIVDSVRHVIRQSQQKRQRLGSRLDLNQWHDDFGRSIRSHVQPVAIVRGLDLDLLVAALVDWFAAAEQSEPDVMARALLEYAKDWDGG